MTNTNPYQFENVVSVYIGKPDRCACGCSGKHTYSSLNREEASKSRGYEVTDDEINNRTVRFVFNIILTKLGWDEAKKLSETCYTYETKTRLYVVYLKGH